MKTGAERQAALAARRLEAGAKVYKLWLSDPEAAELRARFPGARGGIEWGLVIRAALSVEPDDTQDDPVISCPCGWQGHRSGLADDGPGHEWCCPMCGRDMGTGL